MNLLDENFPEDQRPLLQEWHIAFRQVGREFSRLGVKDPDIIPLLHRHGGTTFFTLDQGFFDRALVHPAYCLVWLNTRADDAAWFVRCFLRHPEFRSQAKRMGVVVRVHHEGIQFWRRGATTFRRVTWLEPR